MLILWLLCLHSGVHAATALSSLEYSDSFFDPLYLNDNDLLTIDIRFQHGKSITAQNELIGDFITHILLEWDNILANPVDKLKEAIGSVIRLNKELFLAAHPICIIKIVEIVEIPFLIKVIYHSLRFTLFLAEQERMGQAKNMLEYCKGLFVMLRGQYAFYEQKDKRVLSSIDRFTNEEGIREQLLSQFSINEIKSFVIQTLGEIYKRRGSLKQIFVGNFSLIKLTQCSELIDDICKLISMIFVIHRCSSWTAEVGQFLKMRFQNLSDFRFAIWKICQVESDRHKRFNMKHFALFSLLISAEYDYMMKGTLGFLNTQELLESTPLVSQKIHEICSKMKVREPRTVQFYLMGYSPIGIAHLID